ncbi:dienelactone hydrolase family protein, partial [Mycobacterium tuberculosis]
MPKTTDTPATPDGTCAVRLFTPDGPGRWPGVVMFPDAGGVRDTFDRMAAKLAGFGYVVLLPDVYYREGDWAPFDMKTAFGDPQERARIMFMIGTLTPDRVTRDADALLNYLASRPEVIGDRFGVCGYCMGGRMSVVVAGRLPDRVAAAAAF